MFKIFSTDICWINIKWGIQRVILRPSYIQDARFLKVKKGYTMLLSTSKSVIQTLRTLMHFCCFVQYFHVWQCIAFADFCPRHLRQGPPIAQELLEPSCPTQYLTHCNASALPNETYASILFVILMLCCSQKGYFVVMVLCVTLRYAGPSSRAV